MHVKEKGLGTGDWGGVRGYGLWVREVGRVVYVDLGFSPSPHPPVERAKTLPGRDLG